ncbi:MAG TPA: TetR/AcrR family transcriptional regulator [Polyangiaceae bacterium]|nr:TetR/AcrR family transcriptional regulator [Polyangiaceae bacterium]
MKPPELELVPAPKRGHYDRALSRGERQVAQRERVIAAITAISAAGGELSVASVVEAAGIGRNTFYEYFDDLEHALLAIKRSALHDFSASVAIALQVARTPLERVRALSRAWAENLLENPARAKLALRAQAESLAPTQLSVLAQHLAKVLDAEHEARSALPGLAEPLRVAVVAALFDTVSRAHFNTRALTSEELQRVLADWSMRLLR